MRNPASLDGLAPHGLLVGAERPAPMNEPAFQALYARTAGPLGGYLRRLTGDSALAEDLLQDVYVRLLSAARVPDDPDHCRNYLFKIATNLARDHFRSTRRSLDAQVRAIADGSHDSEAHAVGSLTSDPLERAEVWKLLDRVTPRDRELLLLAYVEGLTHAEIASVTGLMRLSVKPLLSRARHRFAEALRTSDNAPSAKGTLR